METTPRPRRGYSVETRCSDAAARTRTTARAPRYDGSRGDVITPIFINEGGYYYASSGRGIGVAEKTVVDVPKACDSF